MACRVLSCATLVWRVGVYVFISQVNEARDAFDVLDNEEGLLAFENVGKVLDQLGFQDEVGEADCKTGQSGSFYKLFS